MHVWVMYGHREVSNRNRVLLWRSKSKDEIHRRLTTTL
jgi:hypothetical protein